ncbi:MAG: hypothetical protein HQ582_03150, partial [Planctomycetes bacterium]|nr:hypothetical protein [Planctomycetota bacterium]
GGTATFTVVLDSQPTEDATIGLSSSDTTEGTVSPASLIFTPVNWNVPQEVTVTGVGDGDVDGNIGYFIVTAPAASDDADYEGLDADDVSITNAEDRGTRFDMSLVRQPTAFDQQDTGEVSTLPNNEQWIDEWDSFYVEIWVSTLDADDAGIVSAHVDLAYNTDYFTATDIEYGPGFDLLQIGIIDDDAGVVDDLGAGTLATDVGDNQYALLARVRFEPTVDDPGVPLGAEGKYITPVDGGFGLDAVEVMLVGSVLDAYLQPTSGESVGTNIGTFLQDVGTIVGTLVREHL